MGYEHMLSTHTFRPFERLSSLLLQALLSVDAAMPRSPRCSAGVRQMVSVEVSESYKFDPVMRVSPLEPHPPEPDARLRSSGQTLVTRVVHGADGHSAT